MEVSVVFWCLWGWLGWVVVADVACLHLHSLVRRISPASTQISSSAILAVGSVCCFQALIVPLYRRQFWKQSPVFHSRRPVASRLYPSCATETRRWQRKCQHALPSSSNFTQSIPVTSTYRKSNIAILHLRLTLWWVYTPCFFWFTPHTINAYGGQPDALQSQMGLRLILQSPPIAIVIIHCVR